jgi:hypothetical protein
LRNVVSYLMMTAEPAKACPAVPDHHGPDLLQQRFDRRRLTAGSQQGQIAKTAPVTPV